MLVITNLFGFFPPQTIHFYQNVLLATVSDLVLGWVDHWADEIHYT